MSQGERDAERERERKFKGTEGEWLSGLSARARSGGASSSCSIPVSCKSEIVAKLCSRIPALLPDRLSTSKKKS